MKLAISNIAWETPRMDEHLKILADNDCQGLELSPSMIWLEPIEAPQEEVLQFKKKVNGYGLDIPSMHSLTYPRPDLTFYDSEEKRTELIEYIVKLGKIANLVECPVMVFGSSKSRQIGERDRNRCFQIMSEVFYQMAVQLESLGVTLLIEPLGKIETDSINNCDEAFELIQMVNHPHFSLHVDLKSSFTEKENFQRIWSEYDRHIKHCHVANPGLAPPSADCLDHFEAAKAIKNSSYNNYISIEIGRKFGETSSVVKQSLEFVQATYF